MERGSRPTFFRLSHKTLHLQVTCNGQDYTNRGIAFLYQADASVRNISLAAGLGPGGLGLFVTGQNFVNSTALACRIGGSKTSATFLSSNLALCFVPPLAFGTALTSPVELNGRAVQIGTKGLGPRKGEAFSPAAWLGPEGGEGKTLYVEVQLQDAAVPRTVAASKKKHWKQKFNQAICCLDRLSIRKLCNDSRVHALHASAVGKVSIVWRSYRSPVSKAHQIFVVIAELTRTSSLSSPVASPKTCRADFQQRPRFHGRSSVIHGRGLVSRREFLLGIRCGLHSSLSSGKLP